MDAGHETISLLRSKFAYCGCCVWAERLGIGTRLGFGGGSAHEVSEVGVATTPSVRPTVRSPP